MKHYEDLVARGCFSRVVLDSMFTNSGYLQELHKSGKNWLDISDEEALEKDLTFIKCIKI